MKIKIAASMFLFSASFAVKAVTCPPIIPCNETGEASTIAGSNADIQLAEMATQISTDTNAVAQSIIDAAKTQSAALNKGASALTSTMIQVNQTNKIGRAHV